MSREYGKVHTSFWSSETLAGVGDDARLLALYLLTSTHTHQAGAFHLPNAYACHDLGWTAERLAKGFATLSGANWLRRCERKAWVWIVNFASFNPPDNPNQRKSVEKQLALVPDNCSFSDEMNGTVAKPLSNGFRNPPSPAPAPAPVVSKKKSKAPELTIADWIASLDGADAVAADDPLFAWAESVGVPRDWIALAWWGFEARYADDAKRYADWRAVFRRAVREDWLKLWRADRDGSYSLTTAGEQLRREMAR